MDNTQRATETFGEYLLRERRLRNIRLEEIAERTHISLDTLQHFESDAYDKLPPRVYVNGFLRIYAGFVGLDENEVILRFEDALQGINAAQPRAGMQWKANQRLRFWALLILLILLALSLAAGYFYYR
jgi:cytoskeletal protein RodZ